MKLRHDFVHALSAVAFAAERLGFQPDPVPTALLIGGGRRVILNHTRQMGQELGPVGLGVITVSMSMRMHI